MYDMKNIEPRMKPWGASTLTDYSCRRLLSRTIASCLLQQNDKVTRKALVYLLDIIARKSANEWKDERFTCQVFKKNLFLGLSYLLGLHSILLTLEKYHLAQNNKLIP